MTEDAVELIKSLASDQGTLASLRRRAAERGATVVLPEGEDPRMIAAALALREMGIVRPLLLGDPSTIRAAIGDAGADPGALEVASPADDPRHDAVAAHLLERRAHKGMTEEKAAEFARDPLHFGAALVAKGVAHAMVAGAVNATGDVLRAALWNVGLADGIDVVSSSFLMLPPAGHPLDRPLLFADPAVVPEPTEDQLVSIGASAATTWTGLFDGTPRVACLSFSTKGSADHPAAERMRRVAERLRDRGIEADGELQLDAALIESIGQRKAPGSPVAGRADILLFPDLEAGNIGYKIAERLGRYHAVGPLVQGLAKPVFDLSRGCNAAAIVDTVAIAALGTR